jgi:hypothetical protein
MVMMGNVRKATMKYGKSNGMIFCAEKFFNGRIQNGMEFSMVRYIKKSTYRGFIPSSA